VCAHRSTAAHAHGADKRGNSALHVASAIGRLDVARVLLEAGARTDVRNSSGKRPPMWCARR
jgi:ankyrin repeat protein